MRVVAQILTVAGVLALGGCASGYAPVDDRGMHRDGSGPVVREAPPPGVEVYTIESTPAQAVPMEQRAMPLETLPPQTQASESAGAASQSPAVLALLDTAGQQMGAGSYDGAAAALERALRIEPRNARVWQRLADVRLLQNQPEQAESMAMKSNSLAGGDRALLAANWRIIAKARQQRGDVAGAQEAEARAATYGN